MAVNQILSTALSGVLAASRKAEQTANNIANVNTPGYQAKRVVNTSIGSGSAAGGSAGVQAQVFAGNQAVDLTREFVNLTEADLAYKANVQVIRASEDLSKQTVNILT